MVLRVYGLIGLCFVATACAGGRSTDWILDGPAGRRDGSLIFSDGAAPPQYDTVSWILDTGGGVRDRGGQPD